MIPMTSDTLSIGELSRLSGVSPHTLRFYESEGILQPASRGANGHRRYSRNDLGWLEFVLRLKVTGMPLAEIREYAALRARGDQTLQARLALLEQHRQRLAGQIRELATCANALDDKIGIYRTMIDQATAPTGKKQR